MTSAVEQMFYVGKTPWHNSGVKIPDDKVLSIAEGLEASGLNFQVVKEELFTADGRKAPCFATTRTDRNEILGYVGPNYKVLENVEAFNWFQPFLDSKECELHTAGSLYGGRKIWVLAKIKKDPIEITPDDIVEKYLMLSNSHDGTQAIRVGLTAVRIVCANTLAMAHSDSSSQLIRVRHSQSVKENLEAIRDTISIIDEQFKATAVQYKRLLNKYINARDVAKYVVRVLDLEEDDGTISTRSANQLEKIVGLFEKGIGNDLPQVRGTVWSAYNSLTQYLSWEAGRNENSRLDSLWFGQNHAINEKALSLALELSA